MTTNFTLVQEHPTPEELVEDLYKLTPGFRKLWELPDNSRIDNDKTFSCHGVFGEYGIYLEETLSEHAHGTKQALFDYIEKCIDINRHSENGVSNAIHTEFLEFLINSKKLASELVQYMGPETKKAFYEIIG